MKSYTVHAPKDLAGEPLEDGTRLVFVKDGVAWPAFFIPELWFLWHRMWIPFGAYLAMWIAAGVLVGFQSTAMAVVALALNAIAGLEGNNMRRWVLARKGYDEIGIVSGSSLEDCEARFLERWLSEAAQSSEAKAHAAPGPGAIGASARAEAPMGHA